MEHLSIYLGVTISVILGSTISTEDKISLIDKKTAILQDHLNML